MEQRLPQAKEMTRELTTKLILEGGYLAEVEIEQFLDELGWSPCFTLESVKKLEAVRFALQAGDLASAASMAKVYEVRQIEAVPQAAE